MCVCVAQSLPLMQLVHPSVIGVDIYPARMRKG